MLPPACVVHSVHEPIEIAQTEPSLIQVVRASLKLLELIHPQLRPVGAASLNVYRALILRQNRTSKQQQNDNRNRQQGGILHCVPPELEP